MYILNIESIKQWNLYYFGKSWGGDAPPGASFQLFLGDQIFLNFSMPPDYWKIGKKQHFICSNLTLFIVPFFSLFFLFSFSFSSFSFFFLFFIFFLGGPRPPSPPPKWRLCASVPSIGATASSTGSKGSTGTISLWYYYRRWGVLIVPQSWVCQLPVLHQIFVNSFSGKVDMNGYQVIMY